jgi:hypothetical protein
MKTSVTAYDICMFFFSFVPWDFGRMRWAGHAARMGETRNEYRILVGKPERKRPLGRPGRRWVDNIKMDLREIEWGGRDWIELAQDRDQRGLL